MSSSIALPVQEEAPLSSEVTIRQALGPDFDAIASLEPIARDDPRWAAFVRTAIAREECFVATRGDSVLGCAILDYSFFTNGFIPLVSVDAESRRQGIATALIRYLETHCRTPKLFTSTNVSNSGMQELLRKLGFVATGFVDNLDPGDPELVFFKVAKSARG